MAGAIAMTFRPEVQATVGLFSSPAERIPLDSVPFLMPRSLVCLAGQDDRAYSIREAKPRNLCPQGGTWKTPFLKL
jgi:hypothetical protein